jgi:hypothetical protein
MISSFISHLEGQADRYQKAKSIEAGLWREREDQLEVMRDEDERLERLMAGGVIMNISKTHRDLAARVRRFIEELDVVINEEKYNTDISGNWKKR